MVFGKQNSIEEIDKSTITSRSTQVSVNDKRADNIPSNQDFSLTAISKHCSIQTDNMPINLVSRLDAAIVNQLAPINKIQPIVRFYSILFFEIKLFLLFNRRDPGRKNHLNKLFILSIIIQVVY